MPTYFPPKQITNGASSSLLSNIFYNKQFFNKVFTVNFYNENYENIERITKNNSYTLFKNGAFNRILTYSNVIFGNIKVLKNN